MEFDSAKRRYIQEFKNVVKEISKNNQRKIINADTSEETELDKKISQYGILGKNLKNLNFEQKKKFGEFIEKEISIKKKISENYNTEYFVEQERLALQRKLKYEVSIEIEVLVKIANKWSEDETDEEFEVNNHQEIITTVVVGDEDNFISNNIHKGYTKDFEERRNKIRQRIEDIRNGNK